MELPKHIVKALADGRISVGMECFPPDEEEKFIIRLVGSYFKNLSESIGLTEEEARNKLNLALKETIKIENESGNKDALEKACANALTRLFNIPGNTIVIDLHIVDKIDTKDNRLVPEATSDDFTFESISDMEGLTDDIYRRRMLNALIAGASYHYANLNNIVQELYSINPKLLSLYNEVMDLNKYLAYLNKDIVLKNIEGTDGGDVKVFINENGKVRIQADGVIMVALLEEAIKGLLELAISHGLPKDKAKANYILGKADFKLAEQWDLRVGLPLWNRLEDNFKKLDIFPSNIGLSHIFMVLSEMPYDLFKTFLKENFGRTKAGLEMLNNLCEQITKQKEEDAFNDHMNAQQSQINDDEYYSSEELLEDLK